MKKYLLGACLMLLIAFMTACGKEAVDITADSIDEQSIVVFDDGSMQSSLNESFDKDYYDVDELKKFIEEDLEEFNTENSTAVTLNSIAVKNSVVCSVFDYKTTEDYTTYVGVKTELLSASDAKKSSLISNQINKFGKSSTKDKSKAIKSGYKAVIIDNTDGTLKDTVQVSVEGKIKYTSNVSKVDINTVKFKDLSGVAVVVYDPY